MPKNNLTLIPISTTNDPSLFMIIFYCSLFLICSALEHWLLFPALPRGTFLCGSEIAMELMAVVALARADVKKDKTLIGLFALLAAADFAYYVHYYLFLGETNSLSAIVFTSLPYTAVFVIGAFSFMPMILARTKTIDGALAIAVSCPLILWVLAPQLAETFKNEGFSVFFVSRILNSLASLILGYGSVLTMIRSRSQHWSYFASGCLFLALANWALSAEVLYGKTIEFDFYEYFWAFGVAIISFRVTKSKGRVESLESDTSVSLMSEFRIALLSVVAIVLFVLCLYSDTGFARELSLGIAIASLMAIFLSEVFVGHLEQFGRQVGTLISTIDPSTADIPLQEKSLPVEIRTLYENVFAERLLESQDRQKDREKFCEVASQVAHDIRSPVAALRAISEGLSQEDSLKKLIQKVSSRLTDTAEDLLRFRRGIQSHEHNMISIRDLIVVLKEFLQEKSMEYRDLKFLKIEFVNQTTEHDASHSLRIDQNQLLRVLSNLINNSIDSMRGQGDVTLTLKTRGGVWFVIDIRDTGAGFSNQTKKKSNSNGLGLSQARSLMKRCSGFLEISNHPDCGALVSAVVPLLKYENIS